MIIIDHFKDVLPIPDGKDAKLLQQCFLHTLFPDFEPFPADQLQNEATQIGQSFRYVAAIAFATWKNPTFKDSFKAHLKWLCSMPNIPFDLPRHQEALLGVALGIRTLEDPAFHSWWSTKLIPLIAHTHAASGFHDFLDTIASPKRILPDLPIQEYNLILPILLEASPPLMPPYIQYLQTFRKSTFPYYKEDYFRTLLGVRIMDHALEHCIQASEIILTDQKTHIQNAFAQTLEALDHYMLIKARRVVGIFALLGLLLVLLSSAILFITLNDLYHTQFAWEALKWTTLFLSGPLPALYAIISILELIRGRKILSTRAERIVKYHQRYVNRWRKRLLLPIL